MVQITPQKREKELTKLRKQQAKPKGRGYFAYFMLVITVIYIADEIASQIGIQMQSIVASELFAPVFGEEFAVARLGLIGSVAQIGSVLAFIYKPLSDKLGRRIFLIINTFGMGLGLLFVSVSTNIPVYVMGAFVISFFIPHDMQAVYIQECAPAKHRAKVYSVIKSIATLAIFLIPLLRRTFIPDTDLSGWRFVYMIPAGIALAAAVVALICIRESDVFIENRIKQLTTPPEEKNEAQTEGGFINGFRYCFKNKQLLFIMIAGGFLMFGMLVTQNYETIMNYGFAQEFIAGGAATEEALALAVNSVSQALLLFSAGSAVFQLIPGFIADRFGRKVTVIVMSVFMLTFYLLFYFGSRNSWNEYLVGLFCGAAVGSYWSTGDMITLMCSESAPTGIRVSVATVRPLITGVIYAISMLIMMILSNVLGDAKIGIICLLTVVPGMIIGIVILMLKAKETKGVDLETIGEKNET
ncbi:MAG: MFS transporter [Clostridia bacterium]|nr:MFS transporter [Clostridia bacterium]